MLSIKKIILIHILICFSASILTNLDSGLFNTLLLFLNAECLCGSINDQGVL